MIKSIVFIGAYILVLLQFIWYFTCTKHEDVPLILVLVDFILSIIPGFHIIMFIINIFIILGVLSEDIIELKNNWINRTFFALHE